MLPECSKRTMPLTYAITGCSSGIGLEMVRQLASRGDKVYALCRSKVSSANGLDKISEIQGDVTVVEGIDVTDDGLGAKLNESALKDVEIDVLVHNAGGLNGTRALKGFEAMSDQSLANVTPARMLATFDMNTVGPLRVTQALLSKMKQPGGKICVVSTGMGSIADNGSGGTYAYRCSKAAVNMLAKGMSVDLKDKGIAVVAANPCMVQTEFGPGAEALKQFGALTVEYSTESLIKIFDDLSMETTGTFMSVNKDGDPRPFPAGW